MQNFGRNMGKTALKFFIFGATLALTAPYIGATIGLAPTVAATSIELGKMGDPVLVGLAFAIIGMSDALLKPLFAKWFKSPPEDKKTPQ